MNPCGKATPAPDGASFGERADECREALKLALHRKEDQLRDQRLRAETLADMIRALMPDVDDVD